ncbi:hypothetical protein [Acinetobacter sp. WCHAc060025]|uniref:hypothetical protein n=1 Tax=Acinetobacter sp. WCHAc060025 TaxID=2518625 RepID=UPI0010239536|nr:hypothetical protein [Acinetobacter sp. WCHAc060025]RZG71683.1 hypothetical protein EXE09_18280 [Acinetobacter sp. WCHAc060025]
MELSDSLGIIATLLAILGAFKISRDWRNQKGSEVIAKEANEITKDLSAINQSIYELKNTLQSKENALTNLNNIKKISDKINRELLFLKGSLIDDELENNINLFIESKKNLFINIEVSLKSYDMHKFLDEMSEPNMLLKFNQYTNDIDNLITISRKYSLYQRSIKLKNHKSA